MSELCGELKINANAVRSRLSYWIGLGVILEKASDVFQAAKSYQSVVKGKINLKLHTRVNSLAKLLLEVYKTLHHLTLLYL